MPEHTYDLVVIGAGPVGENVADYAHREGLTTVIIEAELVGGECSYWACMPSKALLRPSAVLRAAQHVRGAAQAVTGGLTPADVFARRDAIVGDYDDGSQVEWLGSVGIDLIRGRAQLTGVKQVRVTAIDGTVVDVTARDAVAVCTGSAALIPPVTGLVDAAPWTSREATGASEAPASLVIVGGGVVACEMATVYASLGATVTMLVRGRGLLSGMEPFAGELVTDALRQRGVDVRFGAETTAAHRTDEGGVEVTLGDGGTITAAQILVATGRTPRTDDFGLASVGLANGEWLPVDDTLLVDAPTNADEPWLYAVGDVNRRALLTHEGKYQARAAGRVIAARAKGDPLDTAPWGRHVATADERSVPQVTFTDPEVASVGLTEAAATKAGLRIRTAEYDLSHVAGASVLSDDYVGRAKIVIDDEREVVLGATFVGQDVGELLQSATVAVVGEVPIQRLWHAVPSYPTLSEVWLRLLETDGRA
ncbi:NAD(P)/FAD-dependent oxidoreductase [Amnibacterium sp.]|uniref:dihydrolipoyl dehydrogenase family protein n=1 Tax=Amnibacterium sp. TaxID=1872496 RepID=UPI002610BEF0|nr:NAD(P)/FAD-dependent oxidoreductase [Amnibacterium sp.]MCU1474437.1 pyruvate/2-oxoglutarate dehydrogenase complex, dihydrolipoamide dehydrogenase component [Amnibacterium sp.]